MGYAIWIGLIFWIDWIIIIIIFRVSVFEKISRLIFKWEKMYSITIFHRTQLIRSCKELINVICIRKIFLFIYLFILSIILYIQFARKIFNFDEILDQLLHRITRKWRNLSKIYANKCEMRVFVDALEKVFRVATVCRAMICK